MPVTSDASSSHFDTPTDEPRLAGLANDGKPSDRAAARAAPASSSHSWALMTTKSPIGSPWSRNIRFIFSLSIPSAEPRTPEPT